MQPCTIRYPQPLGEVPQAETRSDDRYGDERNAGCFVAVPMTTVECLVAGCLVRIGVDGDRSSKHKGLGKGKPRDVLVIQGVGEAERSHRDKKHHRDFSRASHYLLLDYAAASLS